MWRKIVLVILLIIFLLGAVILWNTLTIQSKQQKFPVATDIRLDAQEVAKHLSGAIQHKTISSSLNQFYGFGKPFEALHQYLEKTFPLVHQKLKREVVSQFSLVYTWEGKNKNLKPILLMGHLDVVPIDPNSEKDWTFNPFSGQISNGYILGRGTLDDKVTVVGILDAVEYLLKNNFQPDRSIYLAFGHDEEVSGLEGAKQIVQLFQNRKLSFEYILDEGGVLSEGIMPHIEKPVALVGIAEKGYMSVKLTTKGEGGHSSMPPPHTAVGILSKAIVQLEKHQLPIKLEGVTQLMLEYLAPEMPFLTRMAVANQWLLGGILKSQLSKTNSGNAILRTTTAATMIQGGVKDNVLPILAEATINFRIIPGDTPQSIQKHITQVINNPKIKIEVDSKVSQASPISDIKSWGFQQIQKTIHQIFPQAIVCPNLVVGATDARHFTTLSPHIFRFIPVRLKPEDLKRIHGTNERISVKNYAECVTFYIQLMRNSQDTKKQEE